MTKLHKSGCLSGRHAQPVITARPTYYFPPSVYRETHLCPAAAASGTAFWVVFEHTSVSSVQKQFRFQEYLWAPFDMVEWYTKAHTLFVCSLSSTLKNRRRLIIYINIYLYGLKSNQSTVSNREKKMFFHAVLSLSPAGWFIPINKVTSWTKEY